MFCDEKSDEKFKIIPTAIDERGKSESIYQSDNHEIPNIRSDEIIKNIKFWKYFFLKKIPDKKPPQENEKNLLDIAYSRDPEFATKKYRKKNTPREKYKCNAEDSVKHEKGITEYKIVFAYISEIYTIRKQKTIFCFLLFFTIQIHVTD